MRAIIDDTVPGFLLINTFDVEPDRQQALIESLRGFTEQFTCTLHGFIAASVHASLDGRRVVNYVQWESRDDLIAMLATPESQAHMAQVGSLATKIDPVFYRVAYVGAKIYDQ